MRIMITSDWQMGEPQRMSTTINGVNSRLLDKVACVTQMLSWAAENKVSHIFILGDIYDPLGPNVGKLTLIYTQRLINEAIKIAPTFILGGNHDYYKGYWLPEILPATVITKPIMMNVEDWTFGFIPWCSTNEQFLESFESLEWPEDKKKLLFIHQGIEDVIDWQYSEDCIVPKDLIKDVDLVVAGHYHKVQQINNAIYVGDPIQHSFAETNQKKGFLWFDGEGLHFKKIKDMPEFHIVPIREQEELEIYLKKEYKENHYYRFEAKSPTVDLSIIPQSRRIIKKKYILEPTRIDEDSMENFSTESFITKAIEESELQVNKDSWAKLALEIYKRVTTK